MFEIRKLLSKRFAKPAAVVAAAVTLLVGGTGTANAAIYWQNVQLVNQASQQCLAGEYNGVNAGDLGSIVPSCMYYGTGQQWLESGQPDYNGHANVQIMTYGAQNVWLCLAASNPYTGPNGPMSTQTFWDFCDRADNAQIWAMTTAAPPQNVGNPKGPKHFINFYNVRMNVCLDGGIGVYGFPGSCSTTNNWQIWNIYTLQGSEPYHG